jgi:ATP-binding cassette subfamily B multidrug efflux pump
MLRELRPLFGYMRRYRWGYLWGTLSCIATNAVWVFFPQVLKHAIDAMGHGVTRKQILLFAGELVGIAVVKGIFLYAQRWILIGISREIEFDLRNDLFRHL